MNQQAITLVAVAYIGNKPQKRDTTFNTRLTFTPGQVHNIEAFTANRMLQHDTVYAPADSAEHKAVLATLEKKQPVTKPNGPVTTNKTGPVTAVKTPAQQLDEQVDKLAAELKKLPKKDALQKHEVTTALNLTLDLVPNRSVVEKVILDAYKAHLAKKMGIAQAPEQTPAKATEQTPDQGGDQGGEQDENKGDE